MPNADDGDEVAEISRDALRTLCKLRGWHRTKDAEFWDAPVGEEICEDCGTKLSGAFWDYGDAHKEFPVVDGYRLWS